MQNTEEFDQEFNEYNSTGRSGTNSTSEPKKRFWFFGRTEEKVEEKIEEPQKDNNEELKQDLKEISRISFGMMQKLQKEELTKFKKSEEFNKFKEILAKHKIIKA